jgi:cytochrome b
MIQGVLQAASILLELTSWPAFTCLELVIYIPMFMLCIQGCRSSSTCAAWQIGYVVLLTLALLFCWWVLQAAHSQLNQYPEAGCRASAAQSV